MKERRRVVIVRVKSLHTARTPKTYLPSTDIYTYFVIFVDSFY